MDMRKIRYQKTANLVLKGCGDIVQVEPCARKLIDKYTWKKLDFSYISVETKQNLLELCLPTRYPELLKQSIQNSDFTRKNITIQLGDIKYDADTGGYWACGMLYEDIDSAVYVYHTYQKQKNTAGKLLDYLEKEQSDSTKKREVYIKETR